MNEINDKTIRSPKIKYVLRSILKEISEYAELISSDSSFHNSGALTVKVLSPLVLIYASDTNRNLLREDLRVLVYKTRRSDI